MVAQNFFCAGCGTPIQPSKYGSCAACLLRGNSADRQNWAVHCFGVGQEPFQCEHVVMDLWK